MIAFGLILVADAIAIRPERVILIIALAAIGAILPLTSALRELRRPRDAEPLSIDRSYAKEDRFFAISFEARVNAAIGPPPREPGPYAVKFYDPEVIDTVAGNLTIERNQEPASIADVHGDLLIRAGARLPKEAIVGGNAVVEKDAAIRALKSYGDIRLGNGSHVERWIDAAGTIHAARGSDLGVRATAETAISLEAGVTFRFLSAPVIHVGQAPEPVALEAPAQAQPVSTHATGRRHRLRADGALIVEEPFLIPAGTVSRGDVIVRGDVTIGEHAVLMGSIHSDRDVTLEREARVTGSIVSEHDIVLGPSAVAEQHVIAHEKATLGTGARVGTRGRITTLLADGPIELASASVIYGRVLTSAVGRTL